MVALKRSRSLKRLRSSIAKVKSTTSKAADKNVRDKPVEVERRDEQNDKVTEASGREGIDYLGTLFTCLCMDVAADDVDGIAAILGEEVGTYESNKVSKKEVNKKAKKEVNKKAKKKAEAAPMKAEIEKAKQNLAQAEKEAEKAEQKVVAQQQSKMEAAARKQAEKDAMKAAKKAAKEEAKHIALLKTIEGEDKNQVEAVSPPQEDESKIDKLLKQLQEEQEQLNDMEQKTRKILDTIKMIKAAATEAEMESIQEDESFREILSLSWEDDCDDFTAVTETSSFIEEERDFMDTLADGRLCI